MKCANWQGLPILYVTEVSEVPLGAIGKGGGGQFARAQSWRADCIPIGSDYIYLPQLVTGVFVPRSVHKELRQAGQGASRDCGIDFQI